MSAPAHGLARESEELHTLLRLKESEIKRLVGEVEQLRAELADASRQLVTADAESARLLGLHVALTRLVESRDRAAALAALDDVVINIVGSEDFALYERDGATGALVSRGGMGDTAAAHPTADTTRPIVREALESGRVRVAASAGRGGESPVACAPLMIGGEVGAVLVIYTLLPHKALIGPRDVEVLELLRAHAATVLHAAELRHAGRSPDRTR